MTRHLLLVMIAAAVAVTLLALAFTRLLQPSPDRPTTAKPDTTSPAQPQAPPVPDTAAPADLHRLLGLSRSDLDRAVDLVRRFTRAYGSYRYDQPADAYLDPLGPMVTGPLYDRLARAALTPGLQAQRARGRQVATATAHIQHIRDLTTTPTTTATTLTVLVRLQQTLTSTTGPQQSTGRYAVTVLGQSGRWKITDIQPADAGNHGENTSP